MKIELFFIALWIINCQGVKLDGICLWNDDCRNDVPGPLSVCRRFRDTPIWFIKIGRCECPQEHSMLDETGTTCLEYPSHVGKFCQVEKDCHVNLGSLSRCTNHVCTCTDGTTPSEDGTKCIPSKRVGDACEFSEECPGVGDFGACLNKTCSCHPGSVPSQDKTKCLRFSRMNWDCEENSQCVLGDCGDTCQCGLNYQNHLLCVCVEGHTMDFKLMTCVPIRDHLGEACSTRSQCTKMGMSDCIDGICGCTECSEPNYDNNFCNPIP